MVSVETLHGCVSCVSSNSDMMRNIDRACYSDHIQSAYVLGD